MTDRPGASRGVAASCPSRRRLAPSHCAVSSKSSWPSARRLAGCAAWARHGRWTAATRQPSGAGDGRRSHDFWRWPAAPAVAAVATGCCRQPVATRGAVPRAIPCGGGGRAAAGEAGCAGWSTPPQAGSPSVGVGLAHGRACLPGGRRARPAAAPAVPRAAARRVRRPGPPWRAACRLSARSENFRLGPTRGGPRASSVFSRRLRTLSIGSCDG